MDSRNTSSTPTTKKMKLKPDITALKRTLPISLIGKRKFIIHVKLFVVNEDNAWIFELENPDGAAGLVKPISDLIKTNPAIALDMFCVILLMKYMNDEDLNENVRKMQSKRSMWPRLVFVCFKDPGKSSDKFENWVANQLINIANQAYSGCLVSQNLYECQRRSPNVKLPTKDCIILSKKSIELKGCKRRCYEDDILHTKIVGSVKRGEYK